MMYPSSQLGHAGGSLPLHRADLQRTLMTHLPHPDSSTPCTLHLSWRLLDYNHDSESGPVILHFANGVAKTCDILIGADGIKSTIRKLFLSRLPNPEKYERCMEPLWSGTYAYRGLVSMEDLAKVYPGHRLLDLTSSLVCLLHQFPISPVDTYLILSRRPSTLSILARTKCVYLSYYGNVQFC